MATLLHVFPALHGLKTAPGERVELVNHTAVQEVLLDIGMLDFGKGIEAKSNVAVWRTRGDMKQLVGEFAFQCKFKRKDEFHVKAMKRAEQLLVALQYAGRGLGRLGHQYRRRLPPQGQPARLTSDRGWVRKKKFGGP